MEFLFREANEKTCCRKNPYEDAHNQARETYIQKYGMFGEKLKTKEEKELEKKKDPAVYIPCPMYRNIKKYRISGWQQENELDSIQRPVYERRNEALYQIFLEFVGLKLFFALKRTLYEVAYEKFY